MAVSQWLEIYRSYEATELSAAIAQLKKDESVYSSQALGSKSFARDLGELRDKLQAAIRVQAERGNSNRSASGSVDYSCVVVN